MKFDKKIKIEPSSPRGTGDKPDSYYSVSALDGTDSSLRRLAGEIATALEDDKVTDEEQIVMPEFKYMVLTAFNWQRIFESLKIAQGLIRSRIAIQQQGGLSAVQDKEILVRESDSHLSTY